MVSGLARLENRKVLRRFRSWRGERDSNSLRRDYGRRFQAEGPMLGKAPGLSNSSVNERPSIKYVTLEGGGSEKV